MTMLDFIRELRRPRRRTRNGRRRIGVGFEGLESRTMLSGDTLSVAAVIHASDAKAACLDEVQAPADPRAICRRSASEFFFFFYIKKKKKKKKKKAAST